MAYTLTQARPLLNAAELELFEQSRAEPVKQLTGAKLAGAVKRTRTLRDKYRDLYQRQTVAVRTSTPGAVTGDDNERTQRKAAILQEVLERYEARAAALAGQGNAKSESKAGSKTQTTASQGNAKKAGSSSSSSNAAAAKTASGAAAAPAAKAGTKATTKAGTKSTKAAPQAKADKAAVQSPSAASAKSAGSSKKSSVSAQLNTLGGAGTGANTGAAPKPSQAGAAPARSSKAPSRKAPTANNKASAPDVNAPLDTLPSSKRKSPLKTDPTNTAIQAHQSSQGRRAQGKRDSR